MEYLTTTNNTVVLLGDSQSHPPAELKSRTYLFLTCLQTSDQQVINNFKNAFNTLVWIKNLHVFINHLT